MNIARPADGFRLSFSPNANALISQRCQNDAEFELHWNDILSRLKMTAHVEGTIVHTFDAAHRLWVISPPVDSLPTVKIVYRVLGDQVNVKIASLIDKTPA